MTQQFKIGDVLFTYEEAIKAYLEGHCLKDSGGYPDLIKKGENGFPLVWHAGDGWGEARLGIVSHESPWTIVADPSKPAPEPLTWETVKGWKDGERKVLRVTIPSEKKYELVPICDGSDYFLDAWQLLATAFREGWTVEEVREDG